MAQDKLVPIKESDAYQDCELETCDRAELECIAHRQREEIAVLREKSLAKRPDASVQTVPGAREVVMIGVGGIGLYSFFMGAVEFLMSPIVNGSMEPCLNPFHHPFLSLMLLSGGVLTWMGIGGGKTNSVGPK